MILTNHHCGFNAIQSHTTLKNNYLANGLWASDKTRELPNPTMLATFIVRIEDVTEKVLTGITEAMTENEKIPTGAMVKVVRIESSSILIVASI